MAIVKRFRYQKSDDGRWVKASPPEVIGYQVIVSRTSPITGKRQRSVVDSFTKWKDADRANKLAEAAVVAGSFEWEPKAAEPVKEIPTVREASETWIKIRALEVSANHIADLKSALKVHVIPEWGDMPVTELTHDQIQDVVLEWAEQIEEDGVIVRKAKHPQTIARSLDILRGALDRQVRNHVLIANPAAGVVRPSVHKIKKKVPNWTDEQAELFFAEAAKHPWAFAIWLGEVETLRRGEILGLTYAAIRNIDSLDAQSASIGQTCIANKANGGRPLLQERAKSADSERNVKFTKGTCAQFHLHRDRQKFVRAVAGDAWEDNDLVVCDEHGRPIRPDAFTKEFARWVEEIGLPRMTPHALRHHAFTRMLREGVSPALAAHKGGHANVDLVYRTYGHLIESDQTSTNEAIDHALARTGTAEG